MKITHIIFCLASLAELTLSCQKVCLKLENFDGKLRLICQILPISLNVEFHGPDGKLYGSCFAPTPNSERIIDCGDNITQYLDTGHTVLTLADSEYIYGNWICNYGSEFSDSVLIKPNRSNCTCQCNIAGSEIEGIYTCLTSECIIFWTVLFGALIVALSVIRWKVIDRKDTRDQEGYKALEGGPEEIDCTQSSCSSEDEAVTVKPRHGLCHICEKETSFAICDTCARFYCETCSHDHQKKERSHHIIQTEQFPMKKAKPVWCKRCKKNVVIKVCKGCEHLLCQMCECDDKKTHHSIKSIIVESNDFLTNQEQILNMQDRPNHENFIQVSQEEMLKINRKNTKLKPIITVGLVCLPNKHFILADYNNWQLLIVNEKGVISYEKLGMEPRGMTECGEAKVAVTFAYEQSIRFFEIKNNKLSEIRERKLNMKTIGKPFSIAYSDNHFAVEIGERKNGFIAIMNDKGDVIHRVKNKNNKIGYFTGNTIRLALDMRNKVIYVAAIGKKTIYCVSFETGNIEFYARVPSPREIIVLSSAKNYVRILFVSNRGCAIYQVCGNLSELREHEVTPEIILTNDGNIKLPDCISFSQKESLLYVGEDSGDVNIYKFEL